MRIRLGALVVLMLLAGSAAGDTIYKYRRSNGQTIYSSERLHGLELIDSFEYRPPAPTSPQAGAAESARQAEERVRQKIENLNLAWTEVRDAEQALAEAEARLRAGVEPLDPEGRSLATPPTPTPPTQEAGGTAPPAPPAVGGPGHAAPAAVGGPVGTRHGGGRSPEFQERLGKLDADVATARARLERAIQRYNALR